MFGIIVSIQCFEAETHLLIKLQYHVPYNNLQQNIYNKHSYLARPLLRN